MYFNILCILCIIHRIFMLIYINIMLNIYVNILSSILYIFQVNYLVLKQRVQF